MILELSQVWIYLNVLLKVTQVYGKPTINENEHRWKEESRLYSDDDAYIPRDAKENDEIGYEYDWTSDIEYSGVPSYYEDEFLSVETCPSLCTCIVTTIVYCSRRGITSITNDNNNTEHNILSGSLPELTTSLHLGYNNITTLPAKVLQALSGPSVSSLENIYLQSNQISMIDPNAFINLPNLRSLDLSFNFITRLNQPCQQNTDENDAAEPVEFLCPPGTKDEIFVRSLTDSLLSLNLNQNKIKGIPNYSFSNLEKLEVLRLNKNQITWISRKGFYGLHRLKVLELRGNPLGPKTAARLGEILQHFVTGESTVTDSKDLQNDLDKINFFSNGKNGNINAVSSRIRRHLPQTGQILQTIPLNSLETLDLGETNLRSFPSVLPKSLRRLYLDKNKISAIPERLLRDLMLLQILQLGGNRIERVKDDVFSNLMSLSTLDLSRNNLTKLTANSFNGLKYVQSLRLYGNTHLSKLAKKVFWSMRSLRLLYLHDCNLSALPSGPWVFRVSSLWLYGNPINCNCQTSLFILVRLNHPLNQKYAMRLDPYRSTMWDDSDTWQFQRPEKTLCHLPDNFRGYKLQDVRIRDMRCSESIAYDLELARRIAGSRYPNIGSNSQQSTSSKKHVIVERDEDGAYNSDKLLLKETENSNLEELEDLAKHLENVKIPKNFNDEIGPIENLTKISKTENKVGRQWQIELPVSGEDSFANMGDLDSNWDEYPQGFADYRVTDDGIMNLNGDDVTDYREEIEQTMNTTSVIQWNDRIANADYEQYYSEYYDNAESSGELDNDFFELKFGIRFKELTEQGASIDYAIGNLSDLYGWNDMLFSNDSETDYGNL